MQWSRKEVNTKKGIYFNYSHIASLRKKGKSNPEFEFMLNNLTLEELIALKLELTSKTLNYKLSGMKLWNSFPFICRQALVLYASSIAKSHTGAATILGIDMEMYLKVLQKYKIEEVKTINEVK